MVSHSMDDLAAMCDRVVVLKEGEIVRQATRAHVFMHAAKLNEIGLGLPAPQRMAYALIDAGAPLNADTRVFDVYRGEQVGEGRVSLALHLAFRAADRTLSDEDVAPLRARIVAALQDKVGGELRG